MRFDRRKFFAFGLLASLAFLLISGFILYLAPPDNLADASGWSFFGIPKISWKTQFFFSFVFMLVFLALFLFQVDWNLTTNFLRREFPQKVSNSKELWIALVFVFILVSISGLNIPSLQYLARVQTTGTPQMDPNDYFKGEELKSGKPVGERTVNEAIAEIGISRDEALVIFARNKIQHTGNFDLSLKDVADENQMMPRDIFAILSGKEPPSRASNQAQNEEKRPDSEYIKMIGTKTLDELVDIIDKEQPGANVSKEIILERLNGNQIKLAGDDQVLSHIASENKVSVDDLMQIIHTGRRPSRPPVAGAKKLDGPPPHIEKNQNRARQFIGTSITKIAKEYKLNEEGLLKALKAKGYTADKNQTVEEIAKAHNERPGAILRVLRDERLRQEAKESPYAKGTENK
ncbi:MAG: DUF4405 domain-containing protein [Bacteroidales bacterium]|nr:DUF4405 domain-containing protein [Bacteroidales bacterium]MCF8454419.1 DUF4405 domain-containing protein [Bacteroidales bacterium]